MKFADWISDMGFSDVNIVNIKGITITTDMSVSMALSRIFPSICFLDFECIICFLLPLSDFYVTALIAQFEVQ